MNNPWEQIKAPIKDLSALRVSAQHPLDFFWAKDHLGRYLFVYEYPSNSEVIINDPPDLVGIETISLPDIEDKSRLVFVLREKINWELFFALCSDLLNATISIENPKLASTTILHRLRRWQDFLKKTKLDILTEEKIKGLIGELLFLRDQLIPKFGGAESVKFWIGPQGTPQDFNVNECAIEVKCQLGGTIPSVKISSAEQLSSQLPKLYLFVVTLGKAERNNSAAVSLPFLIAEIVSHLEKESSSLNYFEDQLMEVGYFKSDRYLEYNYLLLEEHVYYVTGDFPRICPDDLKNGVISLNYSIGISECLPYEIELEEWELIHA